MVDWLERQLIGPVPGTEDEVEHEIDMSPLDRYSVGVLHPLESEERGIDPASAGTLDEDDVRAACLEDDAEEPPRDGEPGGSERKAEPVRRRRYVPPSSVGFSFCVQEKVRLRIEASAAVYEQPRHRTERGRFERSYVREQLEPACIHCRVDPHLDGDPRLQVEARRRLGAASSRDPGRIRLQAGGARVPIWLAHRLASSPGNPGARQREDARETGPDPGLRPGACREESTPETRHVEGRFRAGIDVRARPNRAGMILTVTLFNRQSVEWDEDARRRAVARVERSLFEARIECFVEEGEVVDYPRVDPTLLTDEERELELQYRERRIFAVGHGAAVNWSVDAAREAPDDECGPDTRERVAKPVSIWSDFLPRAETPIVSVAPRGDADALEIKRLTRDDLPLAQLRGFVGEYGGWVHDRRREAGRLGAEREIEAARRICDRMEQARDRMLRGVEMLASDEDAATAFRLANRAMLRQMDQFDRGRNKPGNARAPRAWRPFQLGFLLAAIESTVSEPDDHRDVLDLIWFQTGGGKTEAYLGLIAFLLVYRRLRWGERGGGTAAFMRYTLRLLTRQQFERAAGLMCALELSRREDAEGEGRLGEEPFSVGIWVGRGVCPNTIADAEAIVNVIRAGGADADDRVRNRLLLSSCPWCGERFDSRRGYQTAYRDFRFHCTNPECEFGASDDPLPCRVIDQSLYEHPPSLLIATIDKFARLAWEERAGAFFGAGHDRRAPDLVLQDELHLIAGPLGSVAGLYEVGIETAIRCRGVRPKYIASTATIRMAKEQVRALYGRGVAVFPPPGLSCDDSWFAKVDRTRPGRLYVGYLAPLKDQHHSLAPLAASLVAAPLIGFREDKDREDLFEAWWTNVVYHGSLRGVGASSNAFQSDVREFGERLIAEYIGVRDSEELDGGTGHASGARLPGEVHEVPVKQTPADRDGRPAAPDRRKRAEKDPLETELRRRFRETQVEQLWSRHTAEQIAETFERLKKPRGSEGCLDAVLSTNMVSVGLDVSRLALMVVNGQPLTTGEYVQATSRVGRGDVPGVVVVNYYRHQARSLSHYESFRPYHESFYRFVEPSSVTPYTFQVRKRALHAALVIALRHACNGLAPNQAAATFERRCPEVRRVVEEFRRRVQQACPEKAEEVGQGIEALLGEWHGEVKRCRQSVQGLHYQAWDKSYARLLYSHEDGLGSKGLWATLNSMRNVESPAVLGMR